MIRDIMNSISPNNEINLFTRVFTKKRKYEGYEIISHHWYNWIFHFKFRNLIYGFNECVKSKLGMIDKLKLLFFYIEFGYVDFLINKIKPDVIHVHGIDESTIAFLKLYQYNNVPIVLTLHGLIGIDKNVKASCYAKEFEKELFESDLYNSINITVISSGIKESIYSHYEVVDEKSLEVILNGSNLTRSKENTYNIRDLYDIDKNKEIIICVGNISELKNQIQVVEAYNLLSSEFKTRTILMFLGEDKLEGKIQNRIIELGLQENIIMCGFVSRENIVNYYHHASINIVASFNEGFGLSIIEGFSFGVPTVTFANLDVVQDVYNKKVMILINERSSNEMSQILEIALRKDWDREYIKFYSQKFSYLAMSTKYNSLYKQLINH